MFCSNEVGLNPTVKMQKFQKEAQAVCKGDRNVNLRAKEPASGLSVEMQVACLIDHASDPNILGRDLVWLGALDVAGQWSGSKKVVSRHRCVGRL